MYQLWTKSHQQFAILPGPHSLVDATTGLAMSLADDTCTIGTALSVQADIYNDEKQLFYQGNSGG
jgi:hypothetical protein